MSDDLVGPPQQAIDLIQVPSVHTEPSLGQGEVRLDNERARKSFEPARDCLHEASLQELVPMRRDQLAREREVFGAQGVFDRLLDKAFAAIPISRALMKRRHEFGISAL